jgi:hypothetical protein
VIDTARLAEAISSSMMTKLTGCEPGSIGGPVLRDLVLNTWERLEQAQEQSWISLDQPTDDLETFMERLVSGSDHEFLSSLRSTSWTDYGVVRELRAMVLQAGGATLLPA